MASREHAIMKVVGKEVRRMEIEGVASVAIAYLPAEVLREIG